MEGESLSSEEFDTRTRKFKQELRDEIMLDLVVVSPDLSPLHRAVICSLIENELKYKLKPRTRRSPKSEGDFKDSFDYEEICKFVKEFMDSQKQELIRMTEIAMNSLKEIRLKISFIFDGRLYRSLLKKIVKLVEKMRTSNKDNKEVAMDFWKFAIKKDQRKAKKKIKKLAKKVLYYKFEHNEYAYQRAIYKVLVHALGRLWRFAWASHQKKLAEKLNTVNEDTPKNKPTSKDKGGTNKRTVIEDNEDVKDISDWNRKTIKETFKKDIKLKAIRLALAYLKENQNAIDDSYTVVKQVVKDYFEANSLLTKQNKKLFTSTVAKVVWESVHLSEGKKKSKEYFKQVAERYLERCFYICSKDCIRRYKKVFKETLLLNKIEDKSILKIASNWGAIMCGQKNADCSNGICINYAEEWISTFVPVIAEAVQTLRVYMAGKESKNKMLITYLLMHCSNGTFNKDHYENFLNECKERMKKLVEILKEESVIKY